MGSRLSEASSLNQQEQINMADDLGEFTHLHDSFYVACLFHCLKLHNFSLDYP